MEVSFHRSARMLAGGFSAGPSLCLQRSSTWSTTNPSRLAKCLSSNHLLRQRTLHTTPLRSATPVPHQAVPGPPPSPPQQSADTPQDRLERKRAKLEELKQRQNIRPNPAKPTSALQKRFWKDVSVLETAEGLQVQLDKRPVRTASKQVLTLPHDRRALATAIALEWDQLVSAHQALKHHYIPLTSLSARAIDIAAADAANQTQIREAIVKMLMRYLSTDTLLCWVSENNVHDTEMHKLREKQKEVAEPIIAHLKTHVFPGVDIVPILAPDSIVPIPQPELTRRVISGWVTGLPAFELAALERGVLATKSLLVATRLVVEWSKELSQVREGSGKKFGVEDAALAASMEVQHQIAQWGEVEDTHDVEHADLRRQLGSVILLIS